MPESCKRAGQARDSTPGQRREAEKREGKQGCCCCPTLQACQGNRPLTNQQILTELLPRAGQEPKSEHRANLSTPSYFSRNRCYRTHVILTFLASFRDKLSFSTCLLSTTSNNAARSYSYYCVSGTVLVSQRWRIESVAFSASMTLAGWLPCPSYHGCGVLPRPLTLG